MRALVALGVLGALARVAHGSEIAGDPPPPPPPPPPPIVVVAPPVATPTPPAAPVVLGNRFTALAGFGMIVLEVHDETGSGMALQPTLTRTYDRVELQAELTLATWADRTGTPHKGRFERIGAAARYQAGRIRIEQTMTLDLVLDAGVGLQRIERDEDTLIERADLEVGFGLRMLTDMAKPSSGRMLFGMEMMMRLLIMPRADAGADLALVLVFGIPVGK